MEEYICLIKKFIKKANIKKFIDKLINKHYSEESCPKWVNRELFMTEMRNNIFNTMLFNLMDELDEVVDANLAYAYVSSSRDTCDDITYKIPKAIMDNWTTFCAENNIDHEILDSVKDHDFFM